MKQLIKLSDAHLAFLSKHGDTEAQTELVYRYKVPSINLARKLLNDFKDTSYAEEDELISIGLYSVFVAAKSYVYRKQTKFTAYWRKIATNEMMECIKDNSPSYLAKRKIKIEKTRFANEEFFIASPITNESDFILDQINDVFDNSPHLFKKGDRELFFDFLSGYTFLEIAKKRRTSFRRVQRRMEYVRKILSDILLDS